MSAVTDLKPRGAATRPAGSRVVAKQILTLEEHVVEIMSDSGNEKARTGRAFEGKDEGEPCRRARTTTPPSRRPEFAVS